MQQLEAYVRANLAKGYTAQQVREGLERQGWSARDIDRAMRAAKPRSRERLVILLTTLGALLLFAAGATIAAFWPHTVVCGDGIVEGNESRTCCQDAGCEPGEECTPAGCVPLTCGECEEKVANRCVPLPCCSDADCDDGDPLTRDTCGDECRYELIVECLDGDGACPPGCLASFDSDCARDTYEYRNTRLGYALRYPPEWRVREDIPNNTTTLLHEGESLMLELEAVPPFFTAETYGNQVIGALTAFDDFEALDRGTIETGVGRGAFIAYRAGGQEGRVSWVVKNGTAYLFSYTGVDDAADAIVRSLREVPRTIQEPFLYRITGPANGWLFGTMHVSEPELPRVVEDALKDSDVIYTELGKATGQPLGTEARLQDVVPEQLYTRVATYLANRGLPTRLVDSMAPWQAAIALPSLPPGESVDERIASYADVPFRELKGLETVDEQRSIFTSMSREEQVAMLRSTMDRLERYELLGYDPYEEMLRVYIEGDERGLRRMMLRDAQADPEMMRRVYDERNERLAERIIEELQPPFERFFAIGAAHLIGEDGVVERLREAGYTIERRTEPELPPFLQNQSKPPPFLQEQENELPPFLRDQ